MKWAGYLLLFGVLFLSGCVSSADGVDEKLAQVDTIVESMNKRIDSLNAELNKEKPDATQAKVLISGIKSDVNEIKAKLAGIDIKTATETQKNSITARTKDAEAILLTVFAKEAELEGMDAIGRLGAFLSIEPNKIDFAEAKKELEKATSAFTIFANYSKAALETTYQINLESLSSEGRSQIAMRKTSLQEDVDSAPYISYAFEGIEKFLEGYQAFLKGLTALNEPTDLKTAKAEIKSAKNKFSESATLFNFVGFKGPASFQSEMLNLSTQMDTLSETSSHLANALEYLEQGNGAAAQNERDKIAGALNIEPSTESLSTAKTGSIYVDALPIGVDSKYANSIREAQSEWEKVNPAITFRETNKENAEIYVAWVKEFGTQTLGHTIYGKVVEVGLGDSNCMSKWKPYAYSTVLHIATHELGHTLGLPDDYNNKSTIMYYQVPTKYETDVDESEVIPAGYVRAYPVCTKNSAASYSFEVTSGEPVDIYVVPTKADYELLSAGKEFNHYTACEGKATKFYQKTCSISAGSWIVLDNSAGSDSSQFRLKATEV